MPRNITVTFDDGSQHVYQGAPDDVTPDAIQARASKEFGKSVKAMDGGRGQNEPESPKSGLSQALDVLTAGPRAAVNLAAGAVRGAGSIGATLLAPRDMAEAGIAKLMGADMPRPERRQAMTDALGTLGADTDSLAFGVGKLGAEIAGTAGAGGMLARGAALIPGAATKAAPLLDAIGTAGFKAGGMTGLPGLGVRSLGGGVTGAASAGLVNPNDAGTGGIIGMALPGAMKVGGVVGQKVGTLMRGQAQTPELAAAVQRARQAGYVIPPTQANPTLVNRLLEGFSGKITTAQNASARNQEVTKNLVTDALGLPKGTTVTPDVLTNVRSVAGQAYDAIGQAGVIKPGTNYDQALDRIVMPHLQASVGFPAAKQSPVVGLIDSLRSNAFDASSAVAKIKELRTAADDAFRNGNTDIGRASKSAAKALEDAIEEHLKTVNQPQLLQQFRDARQLIAKSYTVEKALNPASGGIDARKLGSELKKGKPLSGELRQAAEFGLQFPKAAQTVEGMGSLPQTSPLDWIGAGSIATALGNPLIMAGALARPATRAAALSPLVQNRLVQQPRGVNALMDPAIQQGLYRAAPLIGGGR